MLLLEGATKECCLFYGGAFLIYEHSADNGQINVFALICRVSGWIAQNELPEYTTVLFYKVMRLWS